MMINILCLMEPGYGNISIDTLKEQKDFSVTVMHNDNLFIEEKMTELKTDLVLLAIDNLAWNEWHPFIAKLTKHNIRIVALTDKRNDPKLVELIEAGIDSMIRKDDPRDTAKSIRLIQQGCFFMPTDLMSHFRTAFDEQEKTRKETFIYQLHRKEINLTPRQLEIAYLIGKQFSNKEIASILGITEGTTKVHIRLIYKKIGIKRRKSVISMLNNLEKRKERI